MPMRIALTQRNIDKGYGFLEEVSHPDSPKYGQHWTAKQVANMFRASDVTTKAVKTWLAESGISSDRVSLSQGLNWLNFDAT
ncbi:hypothetical protein LTR28_013729, partial [Elasticomyces elasticus]